MVESRSAHATRRRDSLAAGSNAIATGSASTPSGAVMMFVIADAPHPHLPRRTSVRPGWPHDPEASPRVPNELDHRRGRLARHVAGVGGTHRPAARIRR